MLANNEEVTTEPPSPFFIYYMETQVGKCCEELFPGQKDHCLTEIKKQVKDSTINNDMWVDIYRQEKIDTNVKLCCQEIKNIIEDVKEDNITVNVEDFAFLLSTKCLVTNELFEHILESFQIGEELDKARAMTANFWKKLEDTYFECSQYILESEHYEKILCDPLFVQFFYSFLEWLDIPDHPAHNCFIDILLEIFINHKSLVGQPDYFEDFKIIMEAECKPDTQYVNEKEIRNEDVLENETIQETENVAEIKT
ncbi:uncharacterized protein LOC142322915 [Lycorma delicatula]|uniref:uncharacterized protein LOC142322915 n=1 Tax=Lycorma delicatula TaxID=130591 RepID=UPI003F5184A2